MQKLLKSKDKQQNSEHVVAARDCTSTRCGRNEHERGSGVRYDLLEIGRYLIKIAEKDDRDKVKVRRRTAPRTTPIMPPPPDADTEELTRIARSEYNERMQRAKYVQADLLGEPAWDILLDLYISRAASVRISISSACIASQVPYSTALRWLKVLEQMGLISRIDDQNDGRRSWIELTDDGLQRMTSYLRSRRQPV